MKPRIARMNEIWRTFAQAGVGALAADIPGMSYSHVAAVINYGFGGQRQVIVTIEGNGDCRAFMSKIYTIPEGKTGQDMELGELTLLFGLPGSTPNLAEAIVRRVREASVADSEMIPSKLVEQPAPPVPWSEFHTVADLIRAYVD